ncbi:hypothetical protein [Dawidia soli]|uniref:Uncharacterized protein n=1 Tax=Dawidia soli TaxID=2782352 RepID=A0AAP2DDK3_9BACT|nr:hypothetical protein [Dawidia soli]MBT1689216.1 hypothetical protein [Dawidia soli]
MKDIEDYLLSHEGRLLTKLTSNYQDLNKNLLYAFSVAFVFALAYFNILKDTSVFGVEINLSSEQVLIILPLIQLIPYFLVNNCVQSIANIIMLLHDNTNAILSKNPSARPFQKEDLGFYSEGIGSLQLQFSKWIVKRYLSKSDFSFSLDVPGDSSLLTKIRYTVRLPFKIIAYIPRLSGSIMHTSVWVLFLVLIYILPLLSSLAILYKAKLQYIFLEFTFDDLLREHVLISLCLFAMISYTLLSNLRLYLLYFKELVDLKDSFSVGAIIQIRGTMKSLLAYYRKSGGV